MALSSFLGSVEAPYLYDVDIFSGSNHYSLLVDTRTFEVNGKHILLNGKLVMLNRSGY